MWPRLWLIHPLLPLLPSPRSVRPRAPGHCAPQPVSQRPISQAFSSSICGGQRLQPRRCGGDLGVHLHGHGLKAACSCLITPLIFESLSQKCPFVKAMSDYLHLCWFQLSGGAGSTVWSCFFPFLFACLSGSVQIVCETAAGSKDGTEPVALNIPLPSGPQKKPRSQMIEICMLGALLFRVFRFSFS